MYSISSIIYIYIKVFQTFGKSREGEREIEKRKRKRLKQFCS